MSATLVRERPRYAYQSVPMNGALDRFEANLDSEEELQSEEDDAGLQSEPEQEEEDDGPLEKDEAEEELERVVFGNTDAFKANLKNFALDEEADEGVERSTGFESLNDADLFVTDLATSTGKNVSVSAMEEDQDEVLRSRRAPAWEDSDDERLTVSLASIPRLRKLRRTEAEDLVDGKEYSKRLRHQYHMLSPTPDWARHAMEAPARKKRRISEDTDSDREGSEVEMDSDGELPSVAPLSSLLQDANNLVRKVGTGSGKRRKIRAEVIDIQRTKDVPGIQPSPITSMSFHSQLPLLLSSGPSSTLYLHHIISSPPAPTPNPLLTSMHVRGTPLSTTAFHPNDGRIFLSARRRYFNIWNLNTGRVEKISRVYGQQHEQRSMEHFKLSPDGKYVALLGSTRKGGGVVNFLSASSLQWVSQVRIESRGGIADFCWWRDSRGIAVAGKNGEITEYSILDQRIIARWQDEGAVGTTTLALGGQHEFRKSPIGTDRWIVTGSSSGIVNIYDRREWLASPLPVSTQPVPAQPKPARVLDQLTTPTSHLAFSPDGQILAMASKWKRDALRLVHLPSCTVFKNWPTNSTPLGRITALAFADGEIVEGDVHCLLAIGSEQGKSRLWEVR